MKISDATKTIQGICEFYGVRFFIPLDQGIAVYNSGNDDFHVFRWVNDRYILTKCADTIPNWLESQIGI